jgi:hypothetical protein
MTKITVRYDFVERMWGQMVTTTNATTYTFSGDEIAAYVAVINENLPFGAYNVSMTIEKIEN